jgi:hypothetical protein
MRRGRFTLPTAHRGQAVLVVRKLGLTAADLPVNVPQAAPVRVAMGTGGVMLEGITATVSRWSAGSERGSQLSSLEVVVTPGAQGDISRALQALPGAQAVDEGSGLFVRGGDQTETRILLDGAPLLNPQALEAPAGSSAPTVDPYLVSGIAFTTGGFGVRFGDVLSAVADLRTVGLPSRRRSTVNASIAAVSARTAHPLSTPLPGRVGGQASASASHSRAFLSLNGSTRTFTRDPRSQALSANLVWEPSEGSELKLFGIRRGGAYGIDVDEPSFQGSYDNEQGSGLYVATWRALWGKLAPSAHLSHSDYTRQEEVGAYRLHTRTRSRRAAGEVGWEAGEPLTVRAGAEWVRVRGAYGGRIPLYSDDRGEGAPTSAVNAEREGDRVGLYAEGEWKAGSRLRVTPGVRTDHSTLTGRRTWDPRITASYLVAGGVTLLAAGGVYHQVPEALYFAQEFGAAGEQLPSMRATQIVAGAQAGSDANGPLLRVELYRKSYHDLAQLDRDYMVSGGGTGGARGADLFLKGRTVLGVEGRVAYSYIRSERTDPNTGVLARSPWDITHTVTAVAERSWGGVWRLALAQRYATGRPYTAVAGAEYDEERRTWVPHYLKPMGERLPAFARLDLSASRLHRFSPTRLGIVYASVTNLGGRENVFSYRYSEDYTEKLSVRGLFKRSLFFGASLTF